MFISSVSTVMFNANPLLRYDGYYILSDILEIPNLRQKASTILNRKLGAWCLGLEEPEDPFLPQRHQWLFATYTVASAIYRWVVTLSILYFLNQVFEPYGLKILGQAIALGSIYGLLIQPLWKVYKFFKVPGRLGKVSSTRVYATLAVLFGAIAAFGFIPFPSHVYAPLEVQARHAASVYVAVDGILEKTHVRPGEVVKEGDLLAELHNIDLDIAIADLTGQRDVAVVQLAGLHRVSFSDSRASAQIDPLASSLQGINQQLEKREDDRKKLRLVAPRAGTVLPPPIVEKRADDGAHLPTWSGSPFSPENSGALLMTGTKLCQIGDPHSLEARLVIDQNDVEFVHEGQPVEIMLNQTTDYVYSNCFIERVSTEDLKTSPTHLSSLNGGSLPTKMDAGGVARPLSPIFEAVVPLPEKDPHGLLRLGLVGKAKITTQPRTLWARLYRYAVHTFNFEL
jgi:putative peptide zinc metalloprotease protein